MSIVGQQREVSSQLDNAGQLAAVIDGAADRFGGGFIDREHALILSTPTATDTLRRAKAGSALGAARTPRRQLLHLGLGFRGRCRLASQAILPGQS